MATPATTIDRLETLLRELRRTSIGEAAWLIGIAALATLHVAALIPPFLQPEESDYQTYVLAARGWLNGELYPPGTFNPNSPHFLVTHVPFVFMSTRAGLALSAALNYVGFFLTCRLIIRELRLHLSPALMITLGLLILASPPSFNTFSFGNTTWVLAFFVTVAWVWSRRERPISEGAAMGVLGTVKPLLVAYLLLYVARSRRTALIAMIAAASLTFGAVIAIFGWTTFDGWLASMRGISWYGMHTNLSVMGVLARFGPPNLVFWFVISAAIALATFGAARRVDHDAAWLVVLIASLLTAPLGWRYYLCFGVGPLAAVVLARPVDAVLIAATVLAAATPALTSGVPAGLGTGILGTVPFIGLVSLWVAAIRHGMIGRAVRAGG